MSQPTKPMANDPKGKGVDPEASLPLLRDDHTLNKDFFVEFFQKQLKGSANLTQSDALDAERAAIAEKLEALKKI